MSRIPAFVSLVRTSLVKVTTPAASTFALRRAVATLLACVLLAVSVPPGVARPSVSRDVVSLGIIGSIGEALATFMPGRIVQEGMTGEVPNKPERIKPERSPSQPEREAKVARIEVNPKGDVALQSGQPMVFAAVPVDADGNAVQGLMVDWQSSDKQVVFIKKDGQAVAGKAGNAQLTASVANKQEKIKVTVFEGAKGERFGGKKKDTVRRREDKQARIGDGKAQFTRASWSANEAPKNSRMRRADYEPGTSAARFVPVVYDPIDETRDPLPDNETGSLYQPANEVGAPAGKTEPGARTAPAATDGTETPNSANFGFGVPILDLPGRGPGVSLGLSYNSRVWNKSASGARRTYDVRRGVAASRGFQQKVADLWSTTATVRVSTRTADASYRRPEY